MNFWKRWKSPQNECTTGDWSLRTLVYQSQTGTQTTSHLIYASVELGSSRDRASRESSLRIARNGLPACESSVARQTVFRFSKVGDTVAGVLYLAFCSCGCCGAERSVRYRRS